MALRRPRHVQSAVDREVLALEIRHMEAARPDETPGLLVGDEGIVVPAVPQQPAGFDELFRHRIALGVWRVLAPEHPAPPGIGGGGGAPPPPPPRQGGGRGGDSSYPRGRGVWRGGGGG